MAASHPTRGPAHRSLARAATGTVLTWLLAVLGSVSCGSALAQLTRCATIVDDRERLACYDTLADRERAASEAARPRSPEQTAVAPSVSPTALETAWELRPDLKRGAFNLRPYRPLYALVHGTTDTNEAPSTPTRSLPEQRIGLDRVEAKLQLSFKTKLLQDVFGTAADAWFGYTQQSYWQAANSRYSSPFRETNYQPELMLVHPLPWKPRPLDAGYVGLALSHESNGRGETLSRSWNRLVGDVSLESGAWSIALRPWLRIDTASGTKDDNPDIEDFVGRGELVATFRRGGHVVSFTGRHTLRGGTRSRGSGRLDWAFPLTGHLDGHVQVFSGFGESLIDYNHRQTTVGVGVSFFD